MPTQDEMIQDIYDRLQAQETPLTEEAVRALITSTLESFTGDEPFARKMRFGKADDELIGSKFARHGLGASDIEFLHDVMVASQSRGGRGPSEELTKAFNTVSDAYYLSQDEVRRIDGQALDGLFPRVNKRNIKQLEAAYRAMDTAESGYGNQLIGAQYVGDLWAAARSDNRVFNLIQSLEMTAPTTYVPVEVDMPELLFVSESTANNSSNYTTVKTGSNRVTLSAKKFVIHQMWSGEMDEDSIIPFVPFLRAQLAKSLAFYSDSLVLNGDDTNAATGNINLDDADPADTKHYLAFDGIRHAAIVDNTNNKTDLAAAVTFQDLRAVKGLMLDTTYFHDWSHPVNNDDLVYVADPETADKIATLDEFVSAKTMLGNNAQLLNGQVGSILGHPLVSAMALRKTEADGKLSTTGSNNVKGQIVVFNRNGYKIGWRRRIKLEMERIPATDQDRLVASLRMGFGRFTPTGAASGIEHTAVLYDITV